ncbi:helix-turn-helix domain-containing protein [Amycolatopsis sp. QT-25]|uniref:winged helix-turn-helix transcriptional regulator n=1 Tax=Amycolatopsis sp. QT-25 TaxID=3034022 RepID=UPI0023EA825D|nr:helix-turn-helix domain-containing protein [Amycolatopsis sp. QT-25]WET82912.1 helix-turn-helix domain-containing protein [Amycolatopsis sp. QT-25]
MVTRPAQDRRNEEKRAYDAYLAACPARKLLDEVSGKWVSLVLVALGDGPQRYSDLSRRIDGVSPKMLTQTLRTLERDGLLTRTVTACVPVRVDYELTELGRGLRQLLAGIKGWAETRFEEVETARNRYDARSAAVTTGSDGAG